MARKDVWVTPRPQGWAVKTAGASRAASVHLTQAEAVKEARAMAQARHSELYVQNRHGQIRERDSHGHDSPRRKG